MSGGTRGSALCAVFACSSADAGAEQGGMGGGGGRMGLFLFSTSSHLFCG